MTIPEAVKDNSKLSDLCDRVENLLGGPKLNSDEPFRPLEPETLEEIQLTFEEVERLILKFLLSKGSALGRVVCAQIRLPHHIIESILKDLKQQQMVAFKGTAEMGEYNFAITDYRTRTSPTIQPGMHLSFHSGPVSLPDYLAAM